MFFKRNKSKPKVVLLVFGKGGHTAQMQRFLQNSPAEFEGCEYVAITNTEKLNDYFLATYFCIEARDKYSLLKNLVIFLAYPIIALIQTLRIFTRYRVCGLISTGPGMTVIPALICRLALKKVVFFESWSRVSQKSLAGRFMYRIAHLFFVQHESMLKQYPKAKFKGRL